MTEQSHNQLSEVLQKVDELAQKAARGYSRVHAEEW